MEPTDYNLTSSDLNLNAINVMEILVLQEIDRQLKQLDSVQAQYIKRAEVATYVLKRLPSLYASSQEGLKYQLKQAKYEYKPQIIVAVRQAIAAVKRNPLINSNPLNLQKQLKSRISKLSFISKATTPKIKDISRRDIQKFREKHSKNKHAEYDQMALELATM